MPLRGELLSPEGLEERAKSLAAGFTLAPASRIGGRSVLPRLEGNIRALNAAYRSLADDVHQGVAVPPAAEWLLDNFHLVESEARAVRHDLPVRYYRKLPKLAAREFSGKARIHAMALELIRHGDGRLDAERLTRFVLAFQTVAPLTIGELWAWPSMLKLALLENLRLLTDGIIAGRAATPGGGRRPRAPGERRCSRVAARPAPERLRGAAPAADARIRPPRVPPRRRGGAGACRAGDDARGCGPLREPAPGHRSGLHRQHGDEPQVLCDARLEPLRGAGQPDGGDPAAGPGRGLPADGLRQPRPLPARRGGSRRADRRGAGARGPAHRRERPPGRGAEGGRRQGGARRPSPDRPGPARPRDRRGVPPAPRQTTPPLGLRPCDRGVPRRHRPLDRLRHFRCVRLRRRRGRRRDGDGRGGARAAPRERTRSARRPAHRGRARAAAPAPPPRFRRRDPRQRPHDGGRARAPRQRRGRRAAPGAPGGAGARQPRPPDPLRGPLRLQGRADALGGRRRRDPGRGGGRYRGAQPPARARWERPLLPVPPRSAVEPEGRRLHGLGAQAGEDRGVQPPVAFRDRHQLFRQGRGPVDPPVGALRPHPGRRHATPEGRRKDPDRDHLAPAQQSRSSTPPSGGSRRATASSSRA